MKASRCILPAAVMLAMAGLSIRSSEAATPAIDPAAFAHCAAMTAADERLACYDSLARPVPSPPPAAKATGKSAAHSGMAPGAATTSAATAAAVPAGAAAGTAAVGAASDPAAKSFGLTRHTAPSEEGPERIQAQVTRVETDRLGNVRLSLDNGQLWTFNAPDALLRVGEAVTIKRGALGSFLLTTAGHHTYKVQRSQ